jgi:hypothetical protein
MQNISIGFIFLSKLFYSFAVQIALLAVSSRSSAFDVGEGKNTGNRMRARPAVDAASLCFADINEGYLAVSCPHASRSPSFSLKSENSRSAHSRPGDQKPTFYHFAPRPPKEQFDSTWTWKRPGRQAHHKSDIPHDSRGLFPSHMAHTL